MNFWDYFHQPWVQSALITAAVVASVCSLLSVVVVLKRMAFLGEGISHAGFGGMATAIFFGLSGLAQNLFVVAFCVAAGLLIGTLSKRKHVEADSAIGIVLVASLALGLLIMDLRQTEWYAATFANPAAVSIDELLFGSLVLINRAVMWQAIVIGAAVLVTCALLFKEIVFFAFDEQVSIVFGVRAGLVRNLLLAVLALAIVTTIRVAGFVLGPALLVLPGATALLLSRRLGAVLAWAWFVGLFGTVGGLVLSLWAGRLSPGACIVSLLCLLFAIGFVVKSWRSRRVRA
jgi:ABC-type Mn2+/Zn2+ transport system permease subunit